MLIKPMVGLQCPHRSRVGITHHGELGSSTLHSEFAPRRSSTVARRFGRHQRGLAQACPRQAACRYPLGVAIAAPVLPAETNRPLVFDDQLAPILKELFFFRRIDLPRFPMLMTSAASTSSTPRSTSPRSHSGRSSGSTISPRRYYTNPEVPARRKRAVNLCVRRVSLP